MSKPQQNRPYLPSGDSRLQKWQAELEKDPVLKTDIGVQDPATGFLMDVFHHRSGKMVARLSDGNFIAAHGDSRALMRLTSY